MAITVFISLYSTRLILAALGVADFGLFNLVGGVISMLGFINSSMAAATQRFISFAQGEGDIEKVKRIFNMSTLLHWGIAILVFILLEGAGYFFFDRILNIPSNRIEDAKFIYQFMVISTLFTVISVPYEAIITSHENMLVYAIMGVIEAVLKLSIAIYITYTGMDHLVIYGLLMATLSIFLMLIKRIYCHRVYDECHLHIGQYFDKPLLREIGEFAGWTLMGSSSSIISANGQAVVMNIFFGTIVNAAQGIANQVSGQLGVFAGTMQKALNPLIDKSEGSNNRELMLNAVVFGSKASFFLLMFTFIPVLIEMPYIFNLWLKNIPDYAILFCRLLLIKNLIEQSFTTLSSAINAVGKIRNFQIFTSIVNLIPLPICYFLFYIGLPPYTLYVVFLIYSFVYALIVINHAKIHCDLNINRYLSDTLFPCWLSFLIIFGSTLFLSNLIQNNFLRLLVVILGSIIISLPIIWIVGLTKDEKLEIRSVGRFSKFNLKICW